MAYQKVKHTDKIEKNPNPLLSDSLRDQCNGIIELCSSEGISVIENLTKQEKYDVMMNILEKDCEERSDLEVNALVSIVSDIRFFRDIKQNMMEKGETDNSSCFQLCKNMQGHFLSQEQILFKQGDKGDTFWIIIKGEVRISKRMFVPKEELPQQMQTKGQAAPPAAVSTVPQATPVSNPPTSGNATTAPPATTTTTTTNPQNPNSQQQQGEFIEKEIVRLGSGNCFGEFALNPSKINRRLATVGTTADTFFGFIKGTKIVDILFHGKNAGSSSAPPGAGGPFMEHFLRMSMFKGQTYEILKQFYDVSEELPLAKGNVVYNIHEVPTHVYFIKRGEFSIQVTKNFDNQFIKIQENTNNMNVPPAAFDSNGKPIRVRKKHLQQIQLQQQQRQLEQDQSDDEQKDPSEDNCNEVDEGQSNPQKRKIPVQLKRKMYDDRFLFYELKILSAGECFGEEEVLRKKGCTYYRIYRVVCTSDYAAVFAIPKKQLLRLLGLFPQIAQLIMVQIENKVESRNLRIDHFSKWNACPLNAITMKSPKASLKNSATSTCSLNSPRNPNKQSDGQLHYFVEDKVISGSVESNTQEKQQGNSRSILDSSSNMSLSRRLQQEIQHSHPSKFQSMIENNFIESNTQTSPYLLQQKIEENGGCSNPEQSYFFDKGTNSSHLKRIASKQWKDQYLVGGFTDQSAAQAEGGDSITESSAALVRSTLLFEESMKRKASNSRRKHNMGSISVMQKYLLSFSERYNIPMKDLYPSSPRSNKQQLNDNQQTTGSQPSPNQSSAHENTSKDLLFTNRNKLSKGSTFMHSRFNSQFSMNSSNQKSVFSKRGQISFDRNSF